MGFQGIARIAGSAMTADTVWLNTIASNLANAEAAAVSEDTAYRARKPVFASILSHDGVRVQVLDVIETVDPLNQKYEPGHPFADADGMVFYSNVNPVEEMVDMLSASRAFSTNVEVLVRLKGMQQDLLRMGES